MTTLYRFKATFTKSGAATVPANAPTIKVVGANDAVLVAALTAVTALAELPGTYVYEYSGADNLDPIGRFTTVDTTMDQTTLDSYTSIETREILVDTGTTLPGLMALESTLTAIKGAGWSTETLAAIDALVDAIKAKTDQLTFTIANQVDANALSGGGSGLDAAGVRAAVGLAAANLDTQLGDIDGAIATGVITVVGPVASGGDIEIVAGDDYFNADDRALEWSSADWPDLTAATVTFETGSTSITMTIVTAGAGITQVVRLELTKAQTAALKGGFAFDVDAVLAISNREVTLVRANGVCR